MLVPLAHAQTVKLFPLFGCLGLVAVLLALQPANSAELPTDSVQCLQEMNQTIQDIAAKRYDPAVGIVQKNAEAGCAQAQLFLGLMFMEGDGVPRDCAKGLSLVQSLANRFYGDAQIFLGRLSEFGRCKDQVVTEAYRWYAIAASHPVESKSRDAARDLRIAKQTLLSVSEIEQGDAAAIRWWQENWK
jgi:hypothetical protein